MPKNKHTFISFKPLSWQESLSENQWVAYEIGEEFIIYRDPETNRFSYWAEGEGPDFDSLENAQRAVQQDYERILMQHITPESLHVDERIEALEGHVPALGGDGRPSMAPAPKGDWISRKEVLSLFRANPSHF